MRRIDFYKVKRNDNLAVSEFWNQRFEDIDLRLAARENDAEVLDAATDALLATGLQRLDDTFTPLIIEAQEALNTYGVSFTGESTTSLTVGMGTQVLTLTEATRDAFYYADYVSLRPATDPSVVMLAQVTSYVRATGVLTVDAQSVNGSGTYADWNITIGSPPDTTHASRTDNPHEVTAAQTGAYTEAETNTAISNAIAALPPITTALLKANNLSDLPSKVTARSNLGLGALAIESEVGTGMFASSVRATQAQAEGGTDNVAFMSALRVAQEVAVLLAAATIDGGTF